MDPEKAELTAKEARRILAETCLDVGCLFWLVGILFVWATALTVWVFCHALPT